jgi:hypothetical protein
MATYPKFARLAHYSCECVKFAKLAKFKQNLPFASLASPRKMLWRMSASLASKSKAGWRMSMNLASPTHFQKGSFWRVLKFDKFAVEWPMLNWIPMTVFVFTI